MGATPQRWAKAASLCRRCGLSPAATSTAPAVSVPTPRAATRSGAAVATRGLQHGLEPLASRVEAPHASGQFAEGESGSAGHRGGVSRTEPGRRRYQLRHGAAAQPLPEVGGARDQQRPHLVDGRGAPVHRRAARDSQGANRFDGAGARLGFTHRVPSLRRPGRREGVDWIGFAVPAPPLAMGRLTSTTGTSAACRTRVRLAP